MENIKLSELIKKRIEENGGRVTSSQVQGIMEILDEYQEAVDNKFDVIKEIIEKQNLKTP